MAREKRSFGGIRKLPSKRYQACYTGPDTRVHNAPYTFESKQDAEEWLVDERRLITSGDWRAPRERGPARERGLTFGQYADRWLERRPLKPRTHALYRSLLDRQLRPTFGSEPLRAITREDVGDWYAGLGDNTPTQRAHAYGLLRTILGSALDDQLLASNPCHIRGAGSAKRRHRVKPLSLDELKLLVEAMPERYRALVLVASWCALRFGELAELRRKDVDLTNQVIHVRRAVVRVGGSTIVGTPKSDAGVRDVAIPPTWCPCSASTSRRTRSGAAKACSSRPPKAPGNQPTRTHRVTTFRRRPLRGCSTRPARPPSGPTCASTTCVTPAPSWPPRRARRSPS